jgi:hypothetical protein
MAPCRLYQTFLTALATTVEVLEDSCRQVENQRNLEQNRTTKEDRWRKYDNPNPQHPLKGWWIAPRLVNCRVLEVGCGVGVYVDNFKKDRAKLARKVYGIEPNRMGGVFERRNGAIQLAINILANNDTLELANSIRDTHLAGEHFDLLYSIGKCHMSSRVTGSLHRLNSHRSFFQRCLNTCRLNAIMTPQSSSRDFPGKGPNLYLGRRNEGSKERATLGVEAFQNGRRFSKLSGFTRTQRRRIKRNIRWKSSTTSKIHKCTFTVAKSRAEGRR